jgi:hypothetical protein
MELMRPYKALTEPQPMRRADTPGFTVERPAFKLVLGPGALFAEADDSGTVRGLYYEGTGTLSFSVADDIERQHLKLFVGQEALNQAVESVYILPLGTCADLPTVGDGALAMMSQADYSRFKNAFHSGGMPWLESALNRGLHGDQDVAILFRMSGDVWAYTMDSTAMEEVSLSRLGHPPHVESWWWDAAVSLHRDRAGTLTTSQTRAEVEAKFSADIQRFDVSLALDGSGNAMDGTAATIKLKLLRPVRALTFSCSPRLTVSRVTLNGTTELPFIKEEYSKKTFFLEPYLVVLLPEGTTGDIRLDVAYTAELCFSEFGIVAHYDNSGWYPNMSDADGAQFGFRASAPKGYEAIGVGDLVERKAEGDRETFTYDMQEKVRLASFLLGKFKHTKRSVEGIEVDVALPDNANTITISQNRDKVADEIADALKRYTKMFGPIPYKTLHAGLTGGYTNLGFPSMVMLSWDVFERSGSSWPEQIVAHEVAHQWWYNQVAPLTYRDAWISESMAEYASLVCLRERSGMDTMKKYLSHDFHTFTKLSDVLKKPYVDFGPICLGSRLYTTLDPDDSYQTIVYYKGAWTLLNLAKMASFTPAGEAGFTDALKDMIASCKGKLMSTQDVQDAFERHMKVQVGWYFKQWLQSSVIPKVKVTAKVNGDKLSVEGTQDSQLTLPIPIEVAEGKKKIREYLFFLKPGGSKQEFPLAFKPSVVAVDADRTCLADYQ